MALSRRRFLGRIGALGLGMAIAGPILAACGATPTPQVIEKPVTQVVEKEITRIVAGTPQTVRETVIVEKPVEKQVTKLVEKVVTSVAKRGTFELWTTEQRWDIPNYPETNADTSGIRFLTNRVRAWMESNPQWDVIARYEKPTIERWHALIASQNQKLPAVAIEYLGKTVAVATAGGLRPVEGMFPISMEKGYQTGLFDTFRSRGHLWGLPLHAWVIQCIVVGKVWEEAGVASLMPKRDDGPRSWKLEAFEEGIRAIKKNVPDTWGGIFPGKKGADYQTLPWLSSFGAKLFNPGDHDKVVLNTPEAVKALDWVAKLVTDKVLPYPLDFGGDEHFQYVQKRKLGIMYEDSGWATRDWVKEYKQTDKVFNQFPAAIPTAPGIEKVGLAGGPTGFCFPIRSTDDEFVAATKLALFLSEPHSAPVLVGTRTPARKDVPSAYRDNPEYAWVMKWWDHYGVYDLGIGLPRKTELNEALNNLWGKVFLKTMSTADALKAFEKECNEAIAKG